MSTRTFMIVAHTGRPGARDALAIIERQCANAGVSVRVIDYDTIPRTASLGIDELPVADDISAQGCEVVVVLGGDGTFLRAAEISYADSIPVLGINLGHIGFLAEAEVHRLDDVLEQLVAGTYRIEDRMTLDVQVRQGQEILGKSWALNEASVQNSSRRGVLEVVTEVDGRPVSAFGADGILIATPTGSTAYAFSAGGPVMWPDLEALLLVPSNAHALFARPMVTSPRSVIAVEVDRSGHDALVFCDGRRSFTIPAGGRIEVVRGTKPVRWVRIDSDPFADRLVRKFDLPVTGWRGRQV